MSSPNHLEEALAALLKAGFGNTRKHVSAYLARLGSGSVLVVSHPVPATDEVRQIVHGIDPAAERIPEQE